MAYGVTRFEARYDGRCTNCDGDIAAGDRIGYVDDELACEECCEEEEAARSGPGVLAPSRAEVAKVTEAMRAAEYAERSNQRDLGAALASGRPLFGGTKAAGAGSGVPGAGRGSNESAVRVGQPLQSDEAQADTAVLAAASYDSTPCRHGIAISGCAICSRGEDAAKSALAGETAAARSRESVRRLRGGWGARRGGSPPSKA